VQHSGAGIVGQRLRSLCWQSAEEKSSGQF